VSVSRGGADANGFSSSPSISSDGRYVAFASRASNVVKRDKSHTFDVFVRDLVSHTTSLVSAAIGGAGGNGASDEPAMSANGRYVAFRSSATNLVAGDTNGATDIFVRDLVGKTTKRVSIATGGTQANAESSDPIISADGSLVAFTSPASNLGPPTGVYYEAFTHNARNGATLLAGVGAGETDCNGETIQYRSAVGLSADGKHIAITAWCNASLYLYDRVRRTGVTHLVDATYTGSGVGGDFSSVRYTPNGSTMAWVATSRGPGSVNLLNTATRIGDTIDPKQTGVYSGGLGLSADGERVVYVGGNGHEPIFDMTVGQPKVYSYDRSDGTLRYISVPLGGPAAEANNDCGDPVLSADGITAAFVCAASDLVTGDNNGVRDVFARPVASAPAPELQAIVSTADASVAEPSSGSVNATITVSLDRPPQFDTGINLTFYDVTATSPADYDATPQAVNFAPGQTSATVEVPVYADSLIEGNETFGVTTDVGFGDATLGSHANAVVTIHDATP
jgi:Tol biopolymer transport system component